VAIHMRGDDSTSAEPLPGTRLGMRRMTPGSGSHQPRSPNLPRSRCWASASPVSGFPVAASSNPPPLQDKPRFGGVLFSVNVMTALRYRGCQVELPLLAGCTQWRTCRIAAVENSRAGRTAAYCWRPLLTLPAKTGRSRLRFNFCWWCAR